MKQYKIYKHYSRDDFEILKVGWNWPAFFFTVIWAAYNRLWAILFKTVAIISVLSYVASKASHADYQQTLIVVGSILLIFVAPFVFGVMGNRWAERKLLFAIPNTHMNMNRYGVFKTLVAVNPDGAWELFRQDKTPSDSWVKYDQSDIDMYHEPKKTSEEQENG